jgi:hypothetical protein
MEWGLKGVGRSFLGKMTRECQDIFLNDFLKPRMGTRLRTLRRGKRIDMKDENN